VTSESCSPCPVGMLLSTCVLFYKNVFVTGPGLCRTVANEILREKSKEFVFVFRWLRQNSFLIDLKSEQSESDTKEPFNANKEVIGNLIISTCRLLFCSNFQKEKISECGRVECGDLGFGVTESENWEKCS